ncbi:MAG TPA: ComEC/Rec2 family competence protein [Fibrobacteria bacterium]|nr:ComEC/Rec2 family competence protein [Fibrobacteria bacterium]
MALCTGFLASCGPLEGPGKGRPALRVYFLNVGQGDACLMRTPGNRWFLYDVGNRDDYLIPFLKSVRADTLAAVFLSHPDLDHFGAFPALLREIPVKKAYLPSASNPNPAWMEVLGDLDAYRVESDTLFAGDTLLWEGEVRMRALWPPPHTGLAGNNLSTVLRVEYLSRRILLTGDIEDEAERGLLASGAVPAADILKVAHHGSRTSSGLPFLSAVEPRWAIISCDSSVYGHPHAEAVADLKLMIGDSTRILRTDREGTVGFEIDEWGIRRLGSGE